MPRADDFPPIHCETNPVPTKTNPLGAKGAGEGGIVAVAVLVLLWVLFSGLMHLLVLGFWIVLVGLVGLGVFRASRWSRSTATCTSRRGSPVAGASGSGGRTRFPPRTTARS